MLAELKDSLENLFPDSRVAAGPCVRREIDVARGGTAAVHVLLNGLKKGQPVRFSVCGRVGPAPAARWFQLIDVPV